MPMPSGGRCCSQLDDRPVRVTHGAVVRGVALRVHLIGVLEVGGKEGRPASPARTDCSLREGATNGFPTSSLLLSRPLATQVVGVLDAVKVASNTQGSRHGLLGETVG